MKTETVLGNFSSEPVLFLFICNSKLISQSVNKLCRIWLTGSKKQNHKDKYIFKLSFFNWCLMLRQVTQDIIGLVSSN